MAEGLVTAKFSEECLGSSPDEVVRDATKRIIADTYGAMAAAVAMNDPLLAELLDSEQRVASPGHLVVGSKDPKPLLVAAAVNGYLGYACDLDAPYRPSIIHGAAICVPAAISALRPDGASGADFVSAVAAGIEAMSRVSLALGPEGLYDRGIHPTSLCGTFGAAVTAARLWRLSSQQLANALGLASLTAGGLLAWASDESEQSRPWCVAQAVRGGIEAAALAARNVGAPSGILDPESRYNVFRAWSQPDGPANITALTTPFGEMDAVVGSCFKRHACVGFAHPALDAILELLAEAKVQSIEAIEEIEIRFPARATHMIDDNPLRSHNIRYAVALLLVYGQVRFTDVRDDALARDGKSAILSKVTLVADSSLDPRFPATRPTHVRMRLRDGTERTRFKEFPYGSPQDPMCDEDLSAKFVGNVSLVADAEIAPRAFERFLRLDEVEDAYEELGTITRG